LPGRTPTAAREAFLAPLRQSLSCITSAQLYVSHARPGDKEALTLSDDPLSLRSAVLGKIQLTLGHQFRVIEDEAHGYRVTTAAYNYALLNEEGQELIAWHWHPESRVVRPHLHIAADPLTHKIHIPTARVTIESVLRLLVDELGVSPTRTDFAQVLDDSEQPHLAYRTWG
jgi:hypothetical protein